MAAKITLNFVIIAMQHPVTTDHWLLMTKDWPNPKKTVCIHVQGYKEYNLLVTMVLLLLRKAIAS